jgi:putative colanic acid biosynthesis acetyltransferase WcaF
MTNRRQEPVEIMGNARGVYSAKPESGRDPRNPFSESHKIRRLLWQICWLMFAAWTPPHLAPWRRWILVRFGATMGRGADVRATAKVWYPPHLVMGAGSMLAGGVNCYNQAPIRIGEGVIVSQRAHLCTGSHRTDDAGFAWFAKEIVVEDRAWLASECFVGPGVTVGEGAVLGARGVALRSLDPYTINIGNPAVFTRQRNLPGVI